MYVRPFAELADVIQGNKFPQAKFTSNEKLIAQYTDLLSSYALTMDVMELAGASFGRERLAAVAGFIMNVLDSKIDEIIERAEIEGGGDKEDDED